ncbi:hypothetical protein IscW_ISCW010640, partial [Ixodes scapularis]
MDTLQEEEEGAVAAGGEGSDDQGGQEAEDVGTAGAKKVKNVVRKPQPKLNLEDLDTILGVLDHWAHRTFPRFHSEFFYQRLESLGKKRQLQVYLRRLRLGLEDGVPLVGTVQDADDNALEEVREDPFSSLLDGPRDSAADDGETERPPSPQLPVHTSTTKPIQARPVGAKTVRTTTASARAKPIQARPVGARTVRTTTASARLILPCLVEPTRVNPDLGKLQRVKLASGEPVGIVPTPRKPTQAWHIWVESAQTKAVPVMLVRVDLAQFRPIPIEPLETVQTGLVQA